MGRSILAELAEVKESIQKGYYSSIWEEIYKGRTNDELDILIEKVSFLKDVFLKKYERRSERSRNSILYYGIEEHSFDKSTLRNLREWFLKQKQKRSRLTGT